MTEKRFLPSHRMEPGRKEHLFSLIKTHLLKYPDILFAYLHGSFAKEEIFRDIDVGLYVVRDKVPYLESDLSHELTSLVGIETEVRVINESPIPFQMAVVRDGRLLFSRDEEIRTDFIERISKGYPEYAHFRNLFLEMDGVKRR